VDSSGSFGDGEWSWVVVSRGEIPAQGAELEAQRESSQFIDFSELSRFRLATVRLVQEENFEDVVVWGAAGKGAVLAFTLSRETNKSIMAVDADVEKHGLFMEGSGVRIDPAESLEKTRARKRLVIVANPLHFKEVSAFLGKENLVTHLGLLGKSAITRYS
jgi:hypothetical protein